MPLTFKLSFSEQNPGTEAAARVHTAKVWGHESLLGQTSIRRQHGEQFSLLKLLWWPSATRCKLSCCTRARHHTKGEEWGQEPRAAPPSTHSTKQQSEAHFCWSVGFWMIVFSPSITCCFSWCDSIPAEIKGSINTSELQTSYMGLHP